jgi:hypothetical protein
MADAWIEAADDEPAYKKYRDKFKPGKIFPQDHADLGALYDRYDICSKNTHPSLYSLAPQLKVDLNEKHYKMALKYFVLPPEIPSEPIRSYFWTLATHEKILSVFISLLESMQQFDLTDVRSDLEKLGTKLRSHGDKWKDVIQAKPS